MENSVINFACYEDGRDLAGIASVSLPSINWISNSISGAGIAGNIESVVLGHLDAMSVTLNFHTLTEYGIALAEPRRHNIDLRAAQQDENNVKGTIGTVSVKHVMVVVPQDIERRQPDPCFRC